jgi:hypothetical protein
VDSLACPRHHRVWKGYHARQSYSKHHWVNSRACGGCSGEAPVDGWSTGRCVSWSNRLPPLADHRLVTGFSLPRGAVHFLYHLCTEGNKRRLQPWVLRNAAVAAISHAACLTRMVLVLALFAL